MGKLKGGSRRNLKPRSESSSAMMKLRYILLNQIKLSTYFIQYLQSWRCFLVDFYFISLTFLGDKLSYIIIFPLVIWIINPRFGRLLTLTLILGTLMLLSPRYSHKHNAPGTSVGNFLKNFFALPRPPSPPLWTYEKLWDFGVPSTHSMNSLIMSWFVIYWTWEDLSYYQRTFFICLSLWYITNMILSRMYLAAHSHIDVSFGLFFGVIFFLIWINVYETVETFVATHHYALPILLFAFCIFIFVHPHSSRPSPSLRDSMRLMSIAFGLIVGFRQITHKTTLRSQYSNYFIAEYIHAHFSRDISQLVCKITSLILGQVVLFCGYVLCKDLSFRFFNWILGYSSVKLFFKAVKKYSAMVAIPHPFALDNIDHPQWDLDRRINVTTCDSMILCKVVSSFWVGYALCYFVPVMMINLGLLNESALLSK